MSEDFASADANKGSDKRLKSTRAAPHKYQPPSNTDGDDGETGPLKHAMDHVRRHISSIFPGEAEQETLSESHLYPILTGAAGTYLEARERLRFKETALRNLEEKTDSKSPQTSQRGSGF